MPASYLPPVFRHLASESHILALSELGLAHLEEPLEGEVEESEVEIRYPPSFFPTNAVTTVYTMGDTTHNHLLLSTYFIHYSSLQYFPYIQLHSRGGDGGVMMAVKGKKEESVIISRMSFIGPLLTQSPDLRLPSYTQEVFKYVCMVKGDEG